MTGFDPHQRINLKLFGVSVWLLLTIFFLSSQSDLLVEVFHWRSADALATPSDIPDLVATTHNAPHKVADSAQALFPALPSGADLPADLWTTWSPPNRDSFFLPPPSLYPDPTLPRPPPLLI